MKSGVLCVPMAHRRRPSRRWRREAPPAANLSVMCERRHASKRNKNNNRAYLFLRDWRRFDRRRLFARSVSHDSPKKSKAVSPLVFRRPRVAVSVVDPYAKIWKRELKDKQQAIQCGNAYRWRGGRRIFFSLGRAPCQKFDGAQKNKKCIPANRR